MVLSFLFLLSSWFRVSVCVYESMQKKQVLPKSKYTKRWFWCVFSPFFSLSRNSLSLWLWRGVLCFVSFTMMEWVNGKKRRIPRNTFINFSSSSSFFLLFFSSFFSLCLNDVCDCASVWMWVFYDIHGPRWRICFTLLLMGFAKVLCIPVCLSLCALGLFISAQNDTHPNWMRQQISPRPHFLRHLFRAHFFCTQQMENRVHSREEKKRTKYGKKPHSFIMFKV